MQTNHLNADKMQTKMLILHRKERHGRNEQTALVVQKVQSYLEGKQIRKVLVVPRGLVNMVCG